jgi:hypothetical protein
MGHQMIEIARLVAAGLATVFFLLAAFTKVRYDLDNIVDGMKKVSRLNSAAAFFAALVFAAEVVHHFWPTL